MEKLSCLPQFYNCSTCNGVVETIFAPGPTDGTVIMKVIIPVECAEEELCHTRMQNKARDITGLNVHNLGYADGC